MMQWLEKEKEKEREREEEKKKVYHHLIYYFSEVYLFVLKGHKSKALFPRARRAALNTISFLLFALQNFILLSYGIHPEGKKKKKKKLG